MKNKIKEALKTTYKDAGFGEKAFDGVAEYLTTSVTDEAQIETAVAGVAGMLKALQAETDTVRTAKVKLEKELTELKNASPKSDPKPATPTEDTPEWAKTLITANESMAKRIAAFEGDKVATTRKQQLAAAIPEKFREQYEKDLSRMNFNDDAEYATWLGEIKAHTEGIIAEAVSKGAVFQRPAGGGGTPPPEKPSPEMEARIKSREADTAAPAIRGLPK